MLSISFSLCFSAGQSAEGLIEIRRQGSRGDCNKEEEDFIEHGTKPKEQNNHENTPFHFTMYRVTKVLDIQKHSVYSS